MVAHSKVVSGSTAGLVLKCSGSMEMKKLVPDDEWNVFAATGSALHTVTERAIEDALSDEEVLEKFTDTYDDEHKVDITEEDLKQKVIPALAFFDAAVPADADFKIEEKVHLEGFIDGSFGYADILFWNDETAGLIDWKYGNHRIVKADETKQIPFYLGAAIKCGSLPKRDSYKGYIFQPSTKLDPEEYASEVRYTYDELMDFMDELKEVVEAPTVFNVGEHCKDCRGKIVCQAFLAQFEEDMTTDVKSLMLDELGELYERLPMIESFVKDIKATAMRNAVEGRVMPGWKAETSFGHRKYKDDDAAWNAIGRLGIPAKDRTVSKPISPAQVEKKFKEMGLDPKQINRFLKNHVIKPETGLKLVKMAEDEHTINRAAVLKQAQNLIQE